MTERLDTPAALARHLSALLARDSRLGPVAARAGRFGLRTAAPGFAGLVRIICGQQLSVASAEAIWRRFAAIDGALEPHGYLTLPEAVVRGAGFSAGKYQTVRNVAEAMVAGKLDLDAVERLPAEAAIAELTRLKGVGPWTAELYLMFCAGHPDIFPAGDLALQKAVAHAFELDAPPPIRDLVTTARAWSPHRATAALLFWRYYAAIRNREGVPL